MRSMIPCRSRSDRSPCMSRMTMTRGVRTQPNAYETRNRPRARLATSTGSAIGSAPSDRAARCSSRSSSFQSNPVPGSSRPKAKSMSRMTCRWRMWATTARYPTASSPSPAAGHHSSRSAGMAPRRAQVVVAASRTPSTCRRRMVTGTGRGPAPAPLVTTDVREMGASTVALLPPRADSRAAPGSVAQTVTPTALGRSAPGPDLVAAGRLRFVEGQVAAGQQVLEAAGGGRASGAHGERDADIAVDQWARRRRNCRCARPSTPPRPAACGAARRGTRRRPSAPPRRPPGPRLAAGPRPRTARRHPHRGRPGR